MPGTSPGASTGSWRPSSWRTGTPARPGWPATSHRTSSTWVPTGSTTVADGLSDAFAGYRHEEWRHAALRRTSPVDLHHGYFRFTWARLERGATVMEGWGFGSLDEAGLVRRVVVFEGLEPSRFAGDA